MESVTQLSLINQEVGLRFAINSIAVILLVRLIYFRKYKRNDLFLTFFSFNSVIFFIAYLLNKVEMSIGAAFGLFAVFSMLRYRTSGISTKDMTYLFLCIALGLLMAVAPVDYLSLSIFSSFIILVTYLLESALLIKQEQQKVIVYDNVELIKAGKETELLADLTTRTSLPVHRYTISDINFLKDSCVITIYYY